MLRYVVPRSLIQQLRVFRVDMVHIQRSFVLVSPANLEVVRGGRAQILPLLSCGNWRAFEFQSANKVIILTFSDVKLALMSA